MFQQEVEWEIGPMPAIVIMVKKRECWVRRVEVFSFVG